MMPTTEPAIISVHYHLRPGGVTRVIETHDQILRAFGERHLVLTRERLPDLDYGTDRDGDLADLLREAAGRHRAPRPRLWHFHNPCLGKNPALTRSLAPLADAGEAMILQHHDLAEDGRPDNLEVLRGVAVPYPTSQRIAHAFLNRRDRDVFIAAGLSPDRAVILPNPMPHPLGGGPLPDGPPRVLLPMRGIPRKNLGEMLLLAAAAAEDSRFFQGSAPLREEWLGAYQAWRRFAGEQGLPVDFDVFRDGGPEPWADRATHLLTTSTREGFGMIHLEAVNRRRVLGRRIPYLDLDGFPTDGLYDALWIGDRDFGFLDDDAQRAAILAFVRGEAAIEVEQQRRRTPLRRWLADQLADRDPKCAAAAETRHSDEAHVARIRALKRLLLAAPAGPVGHLDRHLIASAFA
jgi:hypothetical protein